MSNIGNPTFFATPVAQATTGTKQNPTTAPAYGVATLPNPTPSVLQQAPKPKVSGS